MKKVVVEVTLAIPDENGEGWWVRNVIRDNLEPDEYLLDFQLKEIVENFDVEQTA